MTNNRPTILFNKYLQRQASLVELQELGQLLQEPGAEEQLDPSVQALWNAVKEQNIQYPVDWQTMYEQITGEQQEEAEQPVPGRILSIRRQRGWWVAASVLIVLGLASYFLFFNERKENPVVKTGPGQNTNDVKPGSYKAKLRLADGREIILDSAAPGELAKQGNTSVVNKDGQLVYNPSGANGEVLYNTVSTAKGETYTMTLADGSKVWLNAGSSIHFPVAFPGGERRIETTGEVYVKVAKNTAQPFIASTNGMEVLALGTEFNINSYSDEDNISTTLIEGSVKASPSPSKGGEQRSVILKPGQQTKLNSNGQLSAATPVNIDEIVAWKDGWFHFESADLKTILRQFSRWYDIEVVYEGPVTNRTFFGIVKRSNTLKKVLEMLQDNNIEYQIEGKKLIVKSG